MVVRWEQGEGRRGPEGHRARKSRGIFAAAATDFRSLIADCYCAPAMRLSTGAIAQPKRYPPSMKPKTTQPFSSAAKGVPSEEVASSVIRPRNSPMYPVQLP